MNVFQVMFYSDIDAVLNDGENITTIDEELTDKMNACIEGWNDAFTIAVNQYLHDQYKTRCDITYVNILFDFDKVEIFVEGESEVVDDTLKDMLKTAIETVFQEYQSFNEEWNQYNMYIHLDLQ